VCRRILLAGALVLTLFAVGCGARSTELSPSLPEQAECLLVPGPTLAADTIAISLADEVLLQRAPSPHNQGERFVYRHLFGTLIGLDCNGRPRPGLATSWRSSNGGRRWELTLNEDAQFWDGTRLTAAHVASSWRANSNLVQLGIVPESLSVQSEGVVAVDFRESHGTVPPVLAHPALAVLRRLPGTGDVQGTSTRSLDVVVSGGMISVSPVAGHRSQPTVQFRTVTRAQQRDMIDQGIDLLITGDPQVLDYAATRSEYLAVPLPWSRTHVVVAPGSVVQAVPHDSSLGDEPPIGRLDAATLQALARDAVRSEARAAQPPFWWDDLNHCEVSAASFYDSPTHRRGRSETSESARSHRVVYQRGDAVGRDLAERLVALSVSPSRRDILAVLGTQPSDAEAVLRGEIRLLAMGLSPEAFVASLQSGADRAYVFPLPRRPYSVCAWMSNLIAATDWLVPAEPITPDQSSNRFRQSLAPLVDTRRHVVVRRNRIGLLLEWDGTAALRHP
jgi:hypothetical protein